MYNGNPVNKILGYKPIKSRKLFRDIGKNNSTVPCKVCKGIGKQRIPVETMGFKDGKMFVEKSSSFESECDVCGGTGQMTPEQVRHQKAYEDMWCKCKNKTDAEYVPDGRCNCGVGKHHYHCRKCGKITQIG